MEEINACIDNYDERDYPYEDIAWAEIILPKKYICETGYWQNQKADWYIYWCVYYSWAEASNFVTKKRLLWKDFIKNSKTRKEWVGDKISNWTKLLLELWIISWYWQVGTLLSVKQSIFNNRPILTWSNTIDWKATKLNKNIAVRWTWYWHAFHIIWYDDDKKLLICKNSYWPDYMDKWNFYIKYEDFDLLYNTRHSLIENKELLNNYKAKIMENITLERAKKAFEEGIWNWLEGAKSASREETSRMIYRMYEKILQKLMK